MQETKCVTGVKLLLQLKHKLEIVLIKHYAPNY